MKMKCAFLDSNEKKEEKNGAVEKKMKKNDFISMLKWYKVHNLESSPLNFKTQLPLDM
jgi:hypothetical protein